MNALSMTQQIQDAEYEELGEARTNSKVLSLDPERYQKVINPTRGRQLHI